MGEREVRKMLNTWKCTDEQLVKIYEGDIDARNTFYFDNLDIITRIAQNALNREKHPTVTIDDLVQGVYVDMDYFCQGPNKRVENAVDIGMFVRWSCHLAPYGGLAYCREHNPKITCRYGSFFGTDYTDNNFVRLDALMRDNSEKRGTATFEEYVDADDEGDELDELATVDSDDTDDFYLYEYIRVFGEYLTPKQREVFGLTVEGYTATQIAEKLGITLGATMSCQRRIRAVFNKRMPEVVKILADFGIHAEGIADRQPKHFNKTSEKQLEACRRYYERKRARKRAESLPHDAA